MKIVNVMEVISAAHVGRFVEGPFEQRGGIMFVAPPGALKSTVIKNSLSLYPDQLCLGDLNVSSLKNLKSSLASGKYNSLGFGELEKLYERNPGSASNLEGHLRAMIEEGFDKMSFQSPEMNAQTARVLVIAGITPIAYEKRFQHWQDSGFSRRFIWSHWRLADEELLIRAVREWRKINFGKISSTIPGNRTIEANMSKQDTLLIERMLDHGQSKETPYALMKKIYCVLSWRYGKKRAMGILQDFSESLKPGGAILYL